MCFLGYSDHEKSYRFNELSSSRILVSRDAQFIKDSFDSGKRVQSNDGKAVKYCDANKATSDEDSDDRDNLLYAGAAGRAPDAATLRWFRRQLEHDRTCAGTAEGAAPNPCP